MAEGNGRFNITWERAVQLAVLLGALYAAYYKLSNKLDVNAAVTSAALMRMDDKIERQAEVQTIKLEAIQENVRRLNRKVDGRGND